MALLPTPPCSGWPPSARLDLPPAIRNPRNYTATGSHCQSAREDERFAELLTTFISQKRLQDGARLQAQMAASGYEPGLFVSNQFVNLYAKCSALEMAEETFAAMAERNVVTWNILLAGYCTNERYLEACNHLCRMMQSGEAAPNAVTYVTALPAIARLQTADLGKQIHCQAMKTGYLLETAVGNALIDMYWKVGLTESSDAVFNGMECCDAVSWNSAMAAKVWNGHTEEAIGMLTRMQQQGVHPDEFTFVTLLQSRDVEFAREIHGQVIARGLGGDGHVQCALVEAYGRGGKLREAKKVFDCQKQNNSAAVAAVWNAIINMCCENDEAEEAARLVLQMWDEVQKAYAHSMEIMVKVAARLVDKGYGEQVHGLVVKTGLAEEASVANGLVSMYMKAGESSASQRAFRRIQEPDLVSWNSVMRNCEQNGEFVQVMEFFQEMRQEGVYGDEITFACALAALVALGWHEVGRAVHGNMVKRGLAKNAFACSCLVKMYVENKAAEDAKKVFDGVDEKDVVIWNAMIAGVGQNSWLDELVRLMKMMMEDDDVEPDSFTFSTAVAAAAESTALWLGKQIHGMIVKWEVDSDTAVGNALTTMYGKAGYMEEAKRVFSRIEEKNAISWTAMIGALAHNNAGEEALHVFEQMVDSGVNPTERTFVELLTAYGSSAAAEDCLEAMEQRFGIQPQVEHYACMVDMLGKEGQLAEAEELIGRMPAGAEALVWKMLLSASCVHGDGERGRRAADMVIALDPGDPAAYVMLSNLYAAEGRWHEVEETRREMRTKGARKEAAKSWVEVGGQTREFVAGERTQQHTEESDRIRRELDGLRRHLKDEGICDRFLNERDAGGDT